MRIRLHGEEYTTEAATVRTLLQEQDIDGEMRGVAVALNDSVVPRSAWDSKTLSDGDTIEIVKPFRGG